MEPVDSAQRAFQTSSKASARAIASKLLRNPIVRAVCGLGQLKKSRVRVASADVTDLMAQQAAIDECSEMNGVKFTDAQRRVLEEKQGDDRQEWRRTYYIENRGADACYQCQKPIEPKRGRLYCDDECQQAAWEQMDAEIAANGGQIPALNY